MQLDGSVIRWSGSNVNGQTRIGKMGNPELRKLCISFFFR